MRRQQYNTIKYNTIHTVLPTSLYAASFQ